MTPLENIGQLAVEAFRKQGIYSKAQISTEDAALDAWINIREKLTVAINNYKQSPPVDLGAALESIKNRFRLADPETEFRQEFLIKALDDAFRAGQSDNADTARLDWLEKVVCASGYHVELHGCSLTQSNGVVINTGCGSGPFRKSFEGPPDPHPLRQAIDAAIAETQNTQGGKAL